MTEREKLERGLWYDANYDEELLRERERANELSYQFNQVRPGDTSLRTGLLRELLGHLGEHVEVLPPLYVDYGRNVSIGDWSFLNHGAYLMDGAPITIGSHVFVGPNLGAYTAQHPLVADERNLGLERALPITIEDDVWIGANCFIGPGVRIGHGSVVGAGSVVLKSIPPMSVAAGVPCRTIRPITDDDRVERPL